MKQIQNFTVTEASFACVFWSNALPCWYQETSQYSLQCNFVHLHQRFYFAKITYLFKRIG